MLQRGCIQSGPSKLLSSRTPILLPTIRSLRIPHFLGLGGDRCDQGGLAFASGVRDEERFCSGGVRPALASGGVGPALARHVRRILLPVADAPRRREVPEGGARDQHHALALLIVRRRVGAEPIDSVDDAPSPESLQREGPVVGPLPHLHAMPHLLVAFGDGLLGHALHRVVPLRDPHLRQQLLFEVASVGAEQRQVRRGRPQRHRPPPLEFRANLCNAVPHSRCAKEVRRLLRMLHHCVGDGTQATRDAPWLWRRGAGVAALSFRLCVARLLRKGGYRLVARRRPLDVDASAEGEAGGGVEGQRGERRGPGKEGEEEESRQQRLSRHHASAKS
mmetsp:Transcript_34169/g.77967  ORF Transcript_34169/g.77967 Transcript_34169/m.77967 type:complete len:334 (-) Transcript_34169:90-1091(-)